MRFSTFTILKVVLFCLLARDVSSAPQTIPNTTPLIEPCRYTKCTPEWFLQQIYEEERRVIIQNRALFYTRGATTIAKSLSCDPNKFYISIWQIWPAWMYNEDDPRLTWIYEDKTWQRRNKYYQAMSTAFARLARGSATVLHLPEDYNNPPMTGIYGQQEIPALGADTDVVKLFKIIQDPHTSNNAPGQYLIPKSLWRTRQDVVQRNMWETERLLALPRPPGHFAENDTLASNGRCAFSTDPDHPLNILL